MLLLAAGNRKSYKSYFQILKEGVDLDAEILSHWEELDIKEIEHIKARHVRRKLIIFQCLKSGRSKGIEKFLF